MASFNLSITPCAADGTTVGGNGASTGVNATNGTVNTGSGGGGGNGGSENVGGNGGSGVCVLQLVA